MRGPHLKKSSPGTVAWCGRVLCGSQGEHDATSRERGRCGVAVPFVLAFYNFIFATRGPHLTWTPATRFVMCKLNMLVVALLVAWLVWHCAFAVGRQAVGCSDDCLSVCVRLLFRSTRIPQVSRAQTSSEASLRQAPFALAQSRMRSCMFLSRNSCQWSTPATCALAVGISPA